MLEILTRALESDCFYVGPRRWLCVYDLERQIQVQLT